MCLSLLKGGFPPGRRWRKGQIALVRGSAKDELLAIEGYPSAFELEGERGELTVEDIELIEHGKGGGD